MKLPWNRQQADLDREVAYHVETMADALEAEGMSRADAVREARRQFGGVEQVKEECRSESRWAWLEQARQDIRFSWRMMKKSPSISVAAIISLALGIGATTAIWSMADAILWRQMAVPHPEQMLQVLWESTGRNDKLIDAASGGSFRDGGLEVADFFSKSAVDAMQQRAAGKLEIAAHLYPNPVSASWEGNVATTRLRPVSVNFFEVLRLQPAIGRTFQQGTQQRELVVSHAFWERRLGARTNAIGQTIRVNNIGYTLTGVLPRSFFGLAAGDETEMYCRIEDSPLWLGPDSWYRPRAEDPRMWWMQLIARRHPATSLTEARALLNTAFAATWVVKPEGTEQAPRIRLSDARTGLGDPRRQMGNPARILLILVAMVLVVACANIANLLLARGAQREKEVALRVSMGCDAARLMRQFLTESLAIALGGGALSLAVAYAVRQMMTSLLPPNVNPDSLLIDFSPASLAATTAITICTAVLFGLYPAWRATRVNAGPALKEGTGSAGTLSRMRWRPAKALVLTQVAIGVLLVTAAIVYTSQLRELGGRETGFERAHALLFDVRPGELGFTGDRLYSFYRTLEENLRNVPGVTAVGISRIRPMRGGGMHEGISVAGSTVRTSSGLHQASAGFPEALGVPLLAGRPFTPEEVKGERRVIIISEQLAQALKLTNPLGARVSGQGKEWEVIGIARNARYSRLTEARPVAYLPLPLDVPAATVLVRSSVPPMALSGAIREAVRNTSRDVPLVDLFTMEQQISRTLQRERLFAWLCGSFGVLALVLCGVGLYGLMSHITARRTPEVGIRLALGASRSDVTRQVVGEGMRLAAGGLFLGVPLAVYTAVAAQKMRMLPEGPMPYWTLIAAIAVLVVSALLAVAGPALRASTVDPMRALRQS